MPASRCWSALSRIGLPISDDHFPVLSEESIEPDPIDPEFHLFFVLSE
jgi:hypothetical protein